MSSPSLFRKIINRPELRQAGLITFATICAQIVLLGTAPLLARLYSPADFGRLSLFMNSSMLGGAVAALCYEVAILLPKRRIIAEVAFRLSVYLSLVVSLLCAVIYIGFKHWSDIPYLFSHGFYDFALIYVATFLTAWFNSFGLVQSRAKRYGPVALSKFNNSLIPSLTQIGFGLAAVQSIGLQLGRVIGLFATVLILGSRWPEGFSWKRLLRRPRWRALRLVLVRYRDSIIHVPRVLLVRAGSMLPSIMLLSAFGPTVAGLYFFAERLVERPGMLLSDALSRIPLRVFAERVAHNKPVLRLSLLYTLGCSVLVVPGVALVGFFSEPLFRVLFGSVWIPAANYAVILAFLAGVRLASLPMTALIPVLRVHGWTVWLDGIFFMRVFVFPLAASYGFDAFMAVKIYAGLGILYSILNVIFVYSAARRYDLKLKASTP